MRTICVENINLSLIKSRCKRLLLTMNNGVPIIKVPHRYSIAAAHLVMLNNIDKVKRFIEKYRAKRPQFELQETYNFEDFSINFITSSNEKISFEAVENNFIVKLPARFDKSNATALKSIFKEVVKQIAQSLLPRQFSGVVSKQSFVYKSLRLKMVKSIWGSCSRANSITLSCKLVLVPKRLREYVMLHELVHTQEKHHRRSFWQKLDDVMNCNTKSLSKELKKYHHPLFHLL